MDSLERLAQEEGVYPEQGMVRFAMNGDPSPSGSIGQIHVPPDPAGWVSECWFVPSDDEFPEPSQIQKKYRTIRIPHDLEDK